MTKQERMSVEFRLGFSEGRHHFVTSHDPADEARRCTDAIEVGGSDYARGWRLAAHATIWENAKQQTGSIK